MLLAIKISSCAILFLMAVLCGRWPLKLAAQPESRHTISLTNCFAAGVFLGAGLIHTLADSNAQLRNLSDFPLAYVLASVGFFLVFGFDRLIGHTAEPGSFSPYVLAMVLGVHSLIAGTAVGLEQDVSGGLILLGAILAHKGSASFALGASLTRAGLPESTIKRTVAYFALTTPLGIAAGTFLSQYLAGPRAELIEGCFDGLAAGTFLYVAVMEIMADEFSGHGNHRLKYLMTLVGLTVMIGLAFFS